MVSILHNMSNKISQELYNINEYNDEELYEILDLFNPTDRELEAKIIFFIKKYSNMENSSELVTFFEDIYNHFFDVEKLDDEISLENNNERTEGYENLNTEYSKQSTGNYVSNNYKSPGFINSGNLIVGDKTTPTSLLGNLISGNSITSNEIPGNDNIIGNVLTDGNVSIPQYSINYDKNIKPSEEKIAKSTLINKDVAFTKTLDYSKDPLNPLLKQTTTRILSVDSQYRENKSSLTTSFSFDLSEPLKDVVSLKLYSFQIPYTWYTIGKSFGCNFFYLKGETAGIKNGNHDIKISIDPGNYSPGELSTAVNQSIENCKMIYPDVNFLTSGITYNTNTSLSTLTIDIENQYNENSYYISFPYFTSPYQIDDKRKGSIPAFLGFQTNKYFTNSVKSTITLPPFPDTKNPEDNTTTYAIYDKTTTFTASISGTNMTVSVFPAVTNGEQIYIGQTISGIGVISGTTIVSFNPLTKIYIVSKSQTVESTTITANIANNYFTVIKYTGPDEYILHSKTDAEFVASINGTEMTISKINKGNIYVGQTISSVGVLSETTIVSFNPLTGIYKVSKSQIVSSTTITADIASNYIGPVTEYIDETSKVDKQFNIKFSLTTPGIYTRNELFNNLNKQILASTYLDNTESSITRRNIDSANNGFNVNNPNGSYFELKIKPNRKTTNNIINSKIAVFFPDENPIIAQSVSPTVLPIWKGITSCFRFDRSISYYETNNIYAEQQLLNEPQTFLIDDKVHIYLNCVHEGFVLPENEITIYIPIKGLVNGVTFLPFKDLEEYVAAINKAIKTADAEVTNGNGSLNTQYLEYSSMGKGTKAYIDKNGIFNIYFDIEKTFDETTYVMDLTGSIFDTYNLKLIDPEAKEKPSLLIDLTKQYNTFVNTGGLFVTSETILAVIYPKPGSTAGNRNDVTYTLKFGQDKSYTDYIFFEADVNNLFNNYVDPISGRNIFSGTKLLNKITATGYQIFLDIKIAKKLISKNYSVQFDDENTTNASWRNYLFIDTSMFNVDYNLETAFELKNEKNEILNNDNKKILSFDVYQQATISGIASISYNYLSIQKGNNNIINIVAYEDGVQTTTGANDLKIDILQNEEGNSKDFTVNQLVTKINEQFAASLYFSGSTLSTYYIGNQNYLKIRMNINRIYRASDYKLVFYDEFSFVRCYVGTSSVQNTTWDSTLGWILGYRTYTIYNLSDNALYSSVSKLYKKADNIITIIGDTGVCTNLYNYFLICLDDFNQNHLNDGLVTISDRDKSIPLPAYGNKSSFTCDPVSGQLTYNTSLVTDGSHLTEKQIYSLTSIANNQYNTGATGVSVSAKSYGTGPFAKDVFAILPMKVAGLANGSSYMEYGGTLQNQSRNYFGPVNIRRMSVSLISDRGNKVDLNNANWSFSIVVEQLNKLTPGK